MEDFIWILLWLVGFVWLTIYLTRKRTWFDHRSTYISGNQYFGRYLLSSFAIIAFGLGFVLMSSTVYKRARSLGWGKESSTFTAVLFLIFLALALVGSKSDLFVLRLPFIILHLTLWFSNGKPNINFQADQNKADTFYIDVDDEEAPKKTSEDMNDYSSDRAIIGSIQPSIEHGENQTEKINEARINNEKSPNIEGDKNNPQEFPPFEF